MRVNRRADHGLRPMLRSFSGEESVGLGCRRPLPLPVRRGSRNRAFPRRQDEQERCRYGEVKGVGICLPKCVGMVVQR
jgi:hypothetical protein